MQALLLRFGHQRIVLDVEQVIDDEPDGFVGGHPVLRVEALEAYRERIAPESALAAQVEIGVEIAQGELAERAVDGLAPAASGVVGFCYGTPTSMLAEDGDHVVGVVVGFKIEQ